MSNYYSQFRYFQTILGLSVKKKHLKIIYPALNWLLMNWWLVIKMVTLSDHSNIQIIGFITFHVITLQGPLVKCRLSIYFDKLLFVFAAW